MSKILRGIRTVSGLLRKFVARREQSNDDGTMYPLY
jgi:hypothetical protein